MYFIMIYNQNKYIIKLILNLFLIEIGQFKDFAIINNFCKGIKDFVTSKN